MRIQHKSQRSEVASALKKIAEVQKSFATLSEHCHDATNRGILRAIANGAKADIAIASAGINSF